LLISTITSDKSAYYFSMAREIVGRCNDALGGKVRQNGNSRSNKSRKLPWR